MKYIDILVALGAHDSKEVLANKLSAALLPVCRCSFVEFVQNGQVTSVTATVQNNEDLEDASTVLRGVFGDKCAIVLKVMRPVPLPPPQMQDSRQAGIDVLPSV